MKNLNYIFLLLILLIPACSTDNFEELNTDPNRPTSAPASLILNGALVDLYESPWSLTHRWNQYWVCNYNYYGNNEYNWTTNSFDYNTLKNTVKMVEENSKADADPVSVYSAMGKFLKAYYGYRMTMKFGDIPFADALQGAKVTEPKYDTQKQVFAQILNLLDDANNEFGTLIAKGKKTIDGDIYFGGDVTKWQKVVNAFKLRVLIQLSKKVSEPDLKIKERFVEVLNNPAKFPVLSGISEDLAFKYISGINNYPLNPGNEGFDKRRYNLSATHLNKLVELKDPRAFVVADPAEARIAGGMKPTEFGAYVGADPGESLDDMSFKMNKGEYSAINQKRYYGSFGGPENGVQIGYIEMTFNIAEAINLGWVSGDANAVAAWYYKGIRASLDFHGIKDPAVIDNYISQTSIQYKGNNADGLNQILTQKYLGLFMQSGFEPYYNWRRTGVPKFTTGIGTGNGGLIPFRFQYPTAERTANKVNYDAALASQYGGKDDINAKMWVIK
jgi:Starch-binding associating with outer membrane